MRDRGVLFFALVLTAGGVFGIGLALWLAYLFAVQNPFFVILAALFLGVFVWSTIVGFRLLKGEPRGERWAKILYALQIPVLSVPGLTYEYFTGLSAKIVAGAGSANVRFNLGAGAQIYVDTELANVAVGVNVFALIAFVYLWRKLPRAARSVAGGIAQ